MFASSRSQQFRAGALAILPMALAAAPFALILGGQALHQGLTPAEALLMSATVFAGSAQFVAIGLWQHPAPWAALGFAVLVVNLRHTLLGASLVGKMGRFSPRQRVLAAFFLVDEAWAVAERRALAGPLTPAFYAGVGVTIYLVWLASTAAGTLAGAFVPDPGRYGLDFVFPAVFIAIVAGFARSWRAVPIIAAAGLAALAAHALIGGAWYVIAGAAAGMAVAAVLPPADAH